MPHVEPLRAGDPAAVGPYRLAGRLGAGGRGVVYLGRTRTGALVAVKVLHEGLADRLAASIAAARAVEPYGLARVLDTSTDGRPYVVSEYVNGPSLQQAGRLTGEQLRHLAIATATALTAVHQAGLVHGALTPTNILLASDGPRLTDFALPTRPLREAPAHASDRLAEPLTFTAPELLAGTPVHPTPGREGEAHPTPEHLAGTLSHPTREQYAGALAYAAPERLAGQAVGVAADVFSWAAVLVFAATGTPPFGDDEPSAVIHRVLHEEPPLGDLPRALREVVAACLAKDPAARPGMRDVVLRLTVSTRRPAPPPTAPDWERTPDRAWDAPTLLPPSAQTHGPAPAARDRSGPDVGAAALETEEWDAPHQDVTPPAMTGEHPLPPHPSTPPTEAARTPPPSTHQVSSGPATSPHHGTDTTSTGTFSPQGPAAAQSGPPLTTPHPDGNNGARGSAPSAFAAPQDAFAASWGNGRATDAGGGEPLRAGESWTGDPAVPASGQGGGASGEGGGRRRRVLTVVVAVLAAVVVVVLGGAIVWLTPAAPDTAPSPEPSGEVSGRADAKPSPGGRGTSNPAEGLAVVALRAEGVREGECWRGGEVTVRALVRRSGGATAFRYAWVVDGVTAARSSAVVAEDGRRYLSAPQTLRGAGGGAHDVSLRITAPVAVRRTISVTMCPS